MIFRFKDKETYLEGWEYLMRVNIGFICDPYGHTLEIKPIDDDELVEKLQHICNCTSADSLLAKEINKKWK